MKTKCFTLFLLLLLNVPGSFPQDAQISPALHALFEAERAFAKRCGEVGIRASFMEFFTDDAIVFRPKPVKYKEAVKDSPAPPNPLLYVLEWEPIFGEVSAAGDMGYDTGPSVFIDKSAEKPEPQYGFFFSVWKKQADGNWKVVLDVGGAQTKEPYTGSREPKTLSSTKRQTTHAHVNLATARADLLQAEQAFLKSAQANGLASSYTKHLHGEARVHRNGMQPILGQKAVAQYFAHSTHVPTWEPLYAEAAQSGDLGYTYGSYEMHEHEKFVEKGYYARVWKRSVDATWQVVLDTTSPLPPEEK